MRAMSSISVTVLRLIVAGAAQHGADPEALLRAVSLEPGDLTDSDARFSRTVETSLWAEAERLSQHPCLGIDIAERLTVDGYGPIGFAVRASGSLGEAYGRVIRYLRLVANGPVLRLDADGAHAIFAHLPPKTPPAPSRHAVELLFGNLVMLARRGVDPAFFPEAVRFCHKAPADLTRHRALFGPNIKFGAGRDEMELKRDWLSRPQALAEAALAEVLDEHMGSRLAALPADENAFLARVNRALRQEVGGAGLEPSQALLPRVADRLQMSSRTLQRRLRQEGTSLTKQMDETRAQLAASKLRDKSQSITEVAFLLGFSEVSTFHRAFKRWTGKTPAAFREGRG